MNGEKERCTDTGAVICRWYERLHFPEEYDNQFRSALEERSVSACLTPENFDWDSEDGKQNLLCVLYLCEVLAERYRQLGIPEAVLLDTLGDIPRWTKVWSEIKGELYLGELCWLRWIFRMKLLKLGRLQFLMGYARQDIPDAGVRQGEPVLEVHIPRVGPLDPVECDRSLEQAPTFFNRYFPQHLWNVFTCNSWLLDPTLEQILPAESNILRFQHRFTPVSRVSSDAILGFVFRWKTDRRQVLEYSADTRLTKEIQQRLREGGEFYVALGYIEREKHDQKMLPRR